MDGLARACLCSERRRPRLGDFVRSAVRPSVRVRGVDAQLGVAHERNAGYTQEDQWRIKTGVSEGRHTGELGANGDRETVALFPCRRVRLRLAQQELHLLLRLRVVRECLAGYHDRRRVDDLPQLQVVFDPDHLRVFEQEREVLVVVDAAHRRDVRHLRFRVRAREYRRVRRRAEQPERARHLDLSRLEGEPAVTINDRQLINPSRVASKIQTCPRVCRFRQCARRTASSECAKTRSCPSSCL